MSDSDFPPPRLPRRPVFAPSDWSPRPVPQPVEPIRTADPPTPKLRELAERERQRASLIPDSTVSLRSVTANNLPTAAGACSQRGTLADPERAKRFGTAMWELRDHWKELGETGRTALIENAVGTNLTPASMPRMTVASTTFDPGDPRSGVFSPSDWQLRVSSQLLGSREPPARAQFQDLERTVYHEARHAEQWYLAARREAATTTDRRTLFNRIAVSDDVARAAIRNPLRPSTPHAPAVGGPRNADHARTDTDLLACADAMHTAFIENASVRKATIEELDAARGAASAGHDARFRAAYARYRELPEEADAFAAEDLYYANAWAY